VPAVYGWLSLDRRGNFRIQGERIGNAALRDFIARNYDCDARGRWFFQNGPQRVFVRLAYTPFVLHCRGEQLFDHCGEPVDPAATYQDDEGSILILGRRGIGLLDDRDLARYAERNALDSAPRLVRREVAARFGFVAEPAP
jgi:hypothetical protein